MGVWNVAAFSDSFVWSNDEREHDSLDGSVPIRRILKKYIVLANTVVLWKKSYSVILSLRNIPIMQYYVLTYFTAFASCAKNARSLRAFFARLTRLTRECRKISNLIQHTRNVATAQNYNSRKFGLKM